MRRKATSTRKSQIKPHIIVSETEIVVKMSFNREAIDELKRDIPFEERQWDKQDKVWRLSCTKANYSIAVEVLKKHWYPKGKVPVFNTGGDVQATFDTAIDTSSYYTILGVPEDADEKTLKKAHRKLVLRLHPDKGGDAHHFQLVQKAYEVLGNPKKKRKYDAARALMYKKDLSSFQKPRPAYSSNLASSAVSGSWTPPRYAPSATTGPARPFSFQGAVAGALIYHPYHGACVVTNSRHSLRGGQVTIQSLETLNVQVIQATAYHTLKVVPSNPQRTITTGDLCVHPAEGLIRILAYDDTTKAYAATRAGKNQTFAGVDMNDLILAASPVASLSDLNVGDFVLHQDMPCRVQHCYHDHVMAEELNSPLATTRRIRYTDDLWKS